MKFTVEGNSFVANGKEYPCVRIDGNLYITVNQLADISGYHHQTIREKIRNRIIPASRQGNKRVLISVNEVKRLIADGVLIKNIRA